MAKGKFKIIFISLLILIIVIVLFVIATKFLFIHNINNGTTKLK